jgi:hypothetical protein
MAFTTYANTGPFTNNVTPPGISATFLNNVENFIDQIVSSAVADSHITSDGNGNETAVSLKATGTGTGLTVQHNATVSGSLTVSGVANFNNTLNLLVGSITRIAFGFNSVTTSGTTITHGLGVLPACVLLCPSISTTFFVNSTVTTTTFTATVGTNTNCWWLAIA